MNARTIYSISKIGAQFPRAVRFNFSWKYLDYGWRMYDSGLVRWFCVNPLQEKSVSWTPYRYGFNNPVRYSDVAGLWEKTNNGWMTNNHSDISRLLSMIDFETLIFGGVSEAQYYLFIQEEYDGIGGRLSDGSILLSGISGFKRENSDWLYSPYDQNVALDEMNKFGNQMIESNILPGTSLYTYKYYREKSWERMKAKFPIEALTGYTCGVVAEKLWGGGKWLNLNNMKSYSTRFYGNQYFSSGQVKTWKNVAKLASGGLKWIGKGFGLYGGYSTFREYKKHKLSSYGALYVGTGDVLGIIGGPPGAAWSLGTSMGKYMVESNWYFDLIHGGRRW